MRSLLTLWFLAVALPAAGGDAKRLEIEGVGLGDSIAQVKSAWRGVKCPERTAREGAPYNCMAMHTSVAGQAATLVAALDDDGRVARVTLRDLDPAAFDAVVTSFADRLGKPDADANHPRQEPRYGVYVPNRTIEWVRDGATLAGTQYATSNASWITLGRKPSAADIEARAAKRIREGD